MWTVGVDEAGRGPVIGPLVVGAVALPTADLGMLLQQGVKDSKDLTHKKRNELVNWFHEQSKQRGWKFTLI